MTGDRLKLRCGGGGGGGGGDVAARAGQDQRRPPPEPAARTFALALAPPPRSLSSGPARFTTVRAQLRAVIGCPGELRVERHERENLLVSRF